MKKVLEYLAALGIKADPREVKRAYWREAKQNRITQDSPRQIAQYLKINKLTE